MLARIHQPLLFPPTARLRTQVPTYIRMVNSGERGLRALETAAATRKLRNAQRDAVAEQLAYLAALSTAGAAEGEAAVVKAARASVEGTLARDAAAQQRSIEAAIRALKEGTTSEGGADDGLSEMWAAAVAKAKADIASKPAANPLLAPMQVRRRCCYRR